MVPTRSAARCSRSKNGSTCCKDEEQPIDEHLVTILHESRSIALAAVLISVGKRQPDLFLGPLRPMLAAIDFYWIEGILHNRAEGSFRTSSFYERSEAILRSGGNGFKCHTAKKHSAVSPCANFLVIRNGEKLSWSCGRPGRKRIEAANARIQLPLGCRESRLNSICRTGTPSSVSATC